MQRVETVFAGVEIAGRHNDSVDLLQNPLLHGLILQVLIVVGVIDEQLDADLRGGVLHGFEVHRTDLVDRVIDREADGVFL